MPYTFELETTIANIMHILDGLQDLWADADVSARPMWERAIQTHLDNLNDVVKAMSVENP